MSRGYKKIEGGYVLYPRKFHESDVLIDGSPLRAKLWLWMFLQANYLNHGNINRGQFFTTIAEMQEAMSYYVGYRKIIPTKDQIRNCYEAFTKATMITTSKTTRGLIITILNFSEYQDWRNYEAHTEAHDEKVTKPTKSPHYKVIKDKESNEGNEGNKRNKKKGNPPPPPKIEYPGWLIMELWDEFKAHRKGFNPPMTAKAEILNMEELKKLIDEGYNQVDVVNRTIANGWRGFFRPNEKPTKKTKKDLAAWRK